MSWSQSSRQGGSGGQRGRGGYNNTSLTSRGDPEVEDYSYEDKFRSRDRGSQEMPSSSTNPSSGAGGQIPSAVNPPSNWNWNPDSHPVYSTSLATEPATYETAASSSNAHTGYNQTQTIVPTSRTFDESRQPQQQSQKIKHRATRNRRTAPPKILGPLPRMPDRKKIARPPTAAPKRAGKTQSDRSRDEAYFPFFRAGHKEYYEQLKEWKAEVLRRDGKLTDSEENTIRAQKRQSEISLDEFLALQEHDRRRRSRRPGASANFSLPSYTDPGAASRPMHSTGSQDLASTGFPQPVGDQVQRRPCDQCFEINADIDDCWNSCVLGKIPCVACETAGHGRNCSWVSNYNEDGSIKVPPPPDKGRPGPYWNTSYGGGGPGGGGFGDGGDGGFAAPEQVQC